MRQRQHRMFSKVICVVSVVLVALGFFSKPAFAEPAVSNSSYATVNGYSYEYYSHAEAYSNKAYAGASASCTHTNVPTGYIGVYSMIVGSDLIPLAAKDWVYIDSPGAGLTTYASYTGPGTYCGRGYVRFYNGGGYNTYPVYYSPFVQVTSSNGLNDELLESGNELLSEELPGLVQARGISGRTGYIRYDDLGLKSSPSSPSDALASMKLQPVVRYIPVYDEDSAIIDTFPIYKGDDAKVIIR